MPQLYIDRLLPERIITRRDIIKHPKVLFLFGDNLARHGWGGQAKEMRGEINSLGIVTKRLPTHGEDAYFRDSDADIDFIKGIINLDFLRVQYYVNSGKYNALVIPSLGTGLAKLPQYAPQLLEYINIQIASINTYYES